MITYIWNIYELATHKSEPNEVVPGSEGQEHSITS